MSSSSVFLAHDYQSFLKDMIHSRKDSWGILTKLARAADCHRPYLSKVLVGSAHLTPAQGFGVAKFFHMTEEETTHFLLLLERERAGSLPYRQLIDQKIQRSKDAFETISNKVQRPTDSEQKWFARYFSTWIFNAIHMAVSIPELQTTEALSERFHLSIQEISDILKELSKMGLVRPLKDRWVLQGGGWHIPKESPFVAFLHSNWRSRAILDWQKGNKDSIHFTVVQTLSKKDFAKIKTKLLALIEETSRIAGASREEEIVCLTLDYFKV